MDASTPTRPLTDTGVTGENVPTAAALLNGWFEQLDLAYREIQHFWWWRMHPARFILPGLDGGAPWRGEDLTALRSTFRETCARLLAGAYSGAADIDTAMETLMEGIVSMDRAIRAMTASPWWRLGIVLRRLAGASGLKKQQFRMPDDDAAAAMQLFFCWQEMYRRRPRSSGMPAKAPAPAADLPSHGAFWTEIRALLCNTDTATLPLELNINEARLDHFLQTGPTERPLATVIMAAYNRADIMDSAIRSVLEQTWQHWELLVCDDGSTDDTARVVEAFRDARVRRLPLAHGGAARARNAGLREARGLYVAYLDTDNLWHPRYLETMITLLMSQPGRFCAFCRYVDAGDGGAGMAYRRLSGAWYSYDALEEANFIDLNCFVHHRNLYRLFGGFTEALPRGQDWDLALNYAFVRDPLCVNAILAYYRRNSAWNQLTFTQRHKNALTEAVITDNIARRRARGPLLSTKPTTDRPVTFVVAADAENDVLRAERLAAALGEAGARCTVTALPEDADGRNFIPWLEPHSVVCTVGLAAPVLRWAAHCREAGQAVVIDTGADRQQLLNNDAMPEALARLFPVISTPSPWADFRFAGKAFLLGGVCDTCRQPSGRHAPAPVIFNCGNTPPPPGGLQFPEHWVIIAGDAQCCPPGEAAAGWVSDAPNPLKLAAAMAAGVPLLAPHHEPWVTWRMQRVIETEIFGDSNLFQQLHRGRDGWSAAVRERVERAQGLFLRQYSDRAAAAQWAVINQALSTVPNADSGTIAALLQTLLDLVDDSA